MIPQRKFGKTGLNISILGYGCAPAAFLASEQAQLAGMVNGLLDQGLNLIDTATMYPGSEEFIGNHLSGRRKDYVLVSKVGATKAADTSGAPWSEELVTTSIDRGLKLMKTDVIDVMLLHSCDLATLQKGEALAALVKAREAGKIRHVGYSGDNEAAGHACTLPDVAVVETSINYVDQVNIDKVLVPARANSVGIIVKRPVANAAWLGSAGRSGIYVNYTREYVKRHAAMRLDPAEFGFAGDQWAEFALRFAISFPEVSTAIVGTTNPANAAANLAIVKKGPLSDDVIERVRAKFQKTEGASTWTGQT
jgi:aryl-alcohol dehydrogenase-like predicted oxidoreductase